MNFPPVYVLSHNNPQRKERVISRFKKLDIEPIFIETVSRNDPCLSSVNEELKTNYSIMLSHVNQIKHFLENYDDEYGIFCEDDIHIRKTFKKDIPLIIDTVKSLDLEIILLGSLVNFKPFQTAYCFNPVGYVYLNYPDDLWGAHMYMLSRSCAKRMVETYTLEWAKTNSKPFCSDWTLTKDSERRAMIYPLLGVEEGITVTDHYGQVQFHRSCFEFNYREDLYY